MVACIGDNYGKHFSLFCSGEDGNEFWDLHHLATMDSLSDVLLVNMVTSPSPLRPWRTAFKTANITKRE